MAKARLSASRGRSEHAKTALRRCYCRMQCRKRQWHLFIFSAKDRWPVGLMDKASASGAGDSRFESWAGHCSFAFPWTKSWAQQPEAAASIANLVVVVACCLVLLPSRFRRYAALFAGLAPWCARSPASWSCELGGGFGWRRRLLLTPPPHPLPPQIMLSCCSCRDGLEQHLCKVGEGGEEGGGRHDLHGRSAESSKSSCTASPTAIEVCTRSYVIQRHTSSFATSHQCLPIR